MRAVIVYESMYGNTHAVANSVAEGLRDEACDVTVVPVGRATEELTGHCDLLVVGGPTHMHGLPRPSTRKKHCVRCYSAARSSPLEARCASTSSTCITSAYLWCMSNRLTLCVSSARS